MSKVLRVLLVEDDHDLVELMQAFFAINAIDCSVASTLAQSRGLLGAGTEPFDCLVLDLCLPDGNGMEVLADLLDGPSRAAAVFIASGNINAVHRNDERISACFQKPYDLQVLLVELEAIA